MHVHLKKLIANEQTTKKATAGETEENKKKKCCSLSLCLFSCFFRLTHNGPYRLRENVMDYLLSSDISIQL